MGGLGEVDEWWPTLPWLTDEQAGPGKTDESGDGVMDGPGAARVAGQLQRAKGLASTQDSALWVAGKLGSHVQGTGSSMPPRPSSRKQVQWPQGH